MSTFFLPLFSLVVGALLGLLSTILASSIHQRHDVTLRLLDQYLQVRKEIAEQEQGADMLYKITYNEHKRQVKLNVWCERERS